MSTASILNEFGIPWPDADSGKARAAATAWKAIATAAQDALSATGGAASSLSAHNTGPAMDAFNTFWSGVGGPFDACLVVDKPSLLPVLIEACDAMSTACDNFADAVDETKHKLEETAAEITAAITAGALATFFTAGVSDMVGDGVATSLIGTALGSVELLGTTIADIAGAMVSGGIFGAVDSILDSSLGSSAKLALGGGGASPKDVLTDLIESITVSGFTFGGSYLTKAAAHSAALAALISLPDDANDLIPQLPGIIATMPNALETPAGRALTTLANEYAAKGVLNGVQGKGTATPDLPDILGELLNARIEGAADSDGGGEK